jgi:colanic acid/amylovoran biosynthesis glycosyltransferase
MSMIDRAKGARMRVVHYRSVFPVPSETFIREIVTRHRRYEPVVVTHERVDGVNAGDVRIDQLRIRPYGGLSHRSAALRISLASDRLAVALRELRPAVLHAHFGEEGIAAAGPAARLGIPLVVTFYGSDATALGEHWLWQRRFRRLFSRAAAVLAEGPHLAARLIALGAPPERTVIHPIPVRLEIFPFRPPIEPGQGDPLIMLQACRFVEKKGVDLTIAAFGRIAAAVPDAVLWLMGSGPEEQRLRSIAVATGLGSRIQFLPAVPHSRYADILRQAHVFVQPSRTARNGDGEGGAPTALLEAQALGLPIVSTTHGDIPAVVDSEAALLAPPDNVEALAELMLRMIQSPQEWHARARAGRRRIESSHDPDQLSTLLENLYDAVRA